MFNALRYIRNLEAVGIQREQAEAQVQLVLDAIGDEVATKTDMAELRSELKTDMAELRLELKSEMAELRSEISAVRSELKAEISEVKGEISELKSEIIGVNADLQVKMAKIKNEILIICGGISVACSTIGFASIGLMIHFH